MLELETAIWMRNRNLKCKIFRWAFFTAELLFTPGYPQRFRRDWITFVTLEVPA